MNNKWYTLTKGAHKAAKFLTKNGPTILSVIGSVGVVATAVATGYASVEASKEIENKKEQRDTNAEVSKYEIIKDSCPKFKYAVILGATTVCCILGANALNRKQQASMIAAYAFLEERYRKYRLKMCEIYGEESDNDIRMRMAKDELKPTNQPNGETFYDELSGVMFESTTQDVQNGIYHLNRLFVLRGYVTASDYFEALGIDIDKVPKNILDTGWEEYTFEAQYGYRWIDFYLTEQKMSDDDTFTCNIIHLPVQPYYDDEDDEVGYPCMASCFG